MRVEQCSQVILILSPLDHPLEVLLGQVDVPADRLRAPPHQVVEVGTQVPIELVYLVLVVLVVLGRALQTTLGEDDERRFLLLG